MSKGTLSLFGLAVAGLAVVVTTSQGCGGGSSTGSDGGGGTTGSSGNALDICNQVCDKEGTCEPQVPGAADLCKSSVCSKITATGSGTTPSGCGNLTYSQAVSAFNNCLSMSDCTAFGACIESVCKPASGSGGSPGGTGTGTGSGGTPGGTGGTSGGTGGATGAGGSGAGGTAGSADCATTCSKAKGCCVAFFTQEGQDTSTCSAYDSLCTAAPTLAPTNCQSLLSSGSMLNIAACK